MALVGFDTLTLQQIQDLVVSLSATNGRSPDQERLLRQAIQQLATYWTRSVP